MNKQHTKYRVEIKELKGVTLRIAGSSTDIVCHVKAAELEPGIMVTYAIDVYGGVIFLDPKADLTW